MKNPRITRRVGLILLLAGVGMLTAGATAGMPGFVAEDQPSGDAILDQVETTYDSAESLTGTATVTVTNETTTTTATVEYAAKESDKVTYTVRKDGKSFDVGSNGSVGWVDGEEGAYARELPTKGEIDGEEFGEYGKALEPISEGNISATLVDTTEVDEETVHIVDLEPADETTHSVTSTLWIDTKDYSVHRMSATDGTNKTTVEVEETQFNVSIHDSAFKPPTERVSVTTTEMYESFDAIQSATDLSLPEHDGEFVEATHVSRAEDDVIVQQYESDGGSISVITATGTTSYVEQIDAETTVTVDGQPADAVEQDGQATVVWSEDGITTGVTVEGTVEDATAAAGGL